MELQLYITFVVASVALIVIPGPNILVVVSTSITHGTKRGLQTVLGTSTAMAIQLVIAALATTWFVVTIAEGFEWLRWFGVAYLMCLGVIHLLRMMNQENDEKAKITGKGTFARGFIVSLTNPKTILFFGAFLPQFVSQNGEYFMHQIVILSITFLVLATLLDSLYAILAGQIRSVIHGPRVQKIQNGVSGLLFLVAGAWLAVIRKG